MAELDDLQAIIAACNANIKAAVTASFSQGLPGSLPNASGGGITVDHGEYIRRQRETIAWARQQIAIAQGPYEITQQGMS